ncbi:MAG: 3-isopropylmalate dehydratase small subunit [Gemmatimonadetes bacterium]|nr:3-isopropylmalate dehydratase small subunit [Gemmatimonadota bacterium]
MEPFRSFTGRAVALPIDGIDTDQIIPARFLTTTGKDGLGAALFADWRYGPDGAPKPDFPLNRPEAAGARILVAGDNFGCGSSREHAPWALLGWGFRAVVSPSFADIFRNNALGNGLLPIQVTVDAHERILALVGADPRAELAVDLEAQTLTLPDGTAIGFPIDPFARHCLLQGVDRLGFLLALDADIRAFEAAHAAGPVTIRAGEWGSAPSATSGGVA